MKETEPEAVYKGTWSNYPYFATNSGKYIYISDLGPVPLNILKVIYHPIYSMNKFVTIKSKVPQDGAQVFPYMGWLAIMWPSQRVTW